MWRQTLVFSLDSVKLPVSDLGRRAGNAETRGPRGTLTRVAELPRCRQPGPGPAGPAVGWAGAIARIDREIRAAAAALAGVAVRTPLVPFPGADPALLVKPESLQPTGAFKLRGAYAAMNTLPAAARERGVVTHSSGNHGLAVAYAAALLGMPAIVVVPDDAAPVKVGRHPRAGRRDRHLRARPGRPAGRHRANWPRSTAAVLIPPFDDRPGDRRPGHRRPGDRRRQPRRRPGRGPGRWRRADLRRRRRGPRAAPGGARSSASSPSWPPTPGTRCTQRPAGGLAVAARRSGPSPTRSGSTRSARCPCGTCWSQVDDIITVTEDEIAGAMRRLALQARLVAEPGGAVAVAACLFRRAELPAARTRVAVLSGGNIDPALLPSILGAAAADRPRNRLGPSCACHAFAYTTARILLFVAATGLLLPGRGPRPAAARAGPAGQRDGQLRAAVPAAGRDVRGAVRAAIRHARRVSEFRRRLDAGAAPRTWTTTSRARPASRSPPACPPGKAQLSPRRASRR